MKVLIKTTLEVDREAWAHEFAIDPDPDTVEVDVQTYFAGACQDQLVRLGLEAK